MIILLIFLILELFICNDIDKFIKFLDSKERPLFDGGVEESLSFDRISTLYLKGDYKPTILKREEEKLLITHSGIIQNFDGIDYIELTNAAIIETEDKEGNARVFLLPRAVRLYDVQVTFNDDHVINLYNYDYISDVLLFEVMENGSVLYRKRMIKSKPEIDFYFEDPRVHSFLDHDEKRFFLGGTHYEPKEGGYIMNKYVEIEINEFGCPKKIFVNETTGIPNFKNLSPVNQKWIQSKDSTFNKNENDQIVVRTRFMMNFSDIHVTKWSKGYKWTYGEQLFVFQDFHEFQKYDWNYAIEDLFTLLDKENISSYNRVRPVKTKILLTDNGPFMVKEHFNLSIIVKGVKGFGPGAPLLRLKRKKNEIYVSDYKDSTEFLVGVIPEHFLDKFLIKDQEVKYISFDHELRNLEFFQRRHYTLTILSFDSTLTNLDFYYADVIQPKTIIERGINSGVMDLQHVFPMGRQIIDGKNVKIRVFCGIADAHVGSYDFNLLMLILEMYIKDSNQRWLTGQIYIPQ